MRIIFTVTLCLATTPLCAAPRDNELVGFRGKLDWFSLVELTKLSENSLNQKNTNLKISDRKFLNDLRPQFRLFGDQFQLIARPQITHVISSALVDDKRQAEVVNTETKWLDAYASLNASDKITVSFGIQNYQWGAAESLNPSNRIFKETIEGRSLLTATAGKPLARLNVTWAKNLSSVFMAETEAQGENSRHVYRYTPDGDADGYVFEPKSLMKHELNWNDGADYIGFVVGQRKFDGPWVGEYFNVTVFDGLTFYADASHERGSKAWYPIRQSGSFLPAPIITMDQTRTDSNKIETLSTSGIRYSFEGGSDIRWEEILNSAGWSANESELALEALAPKSPQQASLLNSNASKWSKPGLDFRGKRYSLLSLRVPDLFEVKDLTTYVRGLVSHMDQSKQYYGSIEYATDHVTLLSAILYNQGKENKDLYSFVNYSGLFGVKQSF